MKKQLKKKVFAAMSGGVDSSVAAMLLKKRGYEVVGVFMRCYNIDGCAEKDSEDARRVAEKLKIPFYVWDFEEEYKRRVVDYMIDGYRRGLTPNPDVMCNKEIKFGLFLEKALAMGADYVATGHYVRLAARKNFAVLDHTSLAPAASSFWSSRTDRRKQIAADRAQSAAGVSNNKIFSLFSARDQNKDQSYFLWMLTQEQLQYCLFPIGDYLKSEVREMARKANLPTADKKDSQGICFLGKVTLQDFLKQYIPEWRGEVLTTAGEKIGEHIGSQFYTIGQRHIGVSNSSPVYVAEKNIATNTLVVAEGSDNPALYKKEIELDDVNFINQEHSNILQNVGMLEVLARVRYRQPLMPAKLTNLKLKTYKLEFDAAVKFVAPGQSAVFYEKSPSTSSGLEMLGGGVIV